MSSIRMSQVKWTSSHSWTTYIFISFKILDEVKLFVTNNFSTNTNKGCNPLLALRTVLGMQEALNKCFCCCCCHVWVPRVSLSFLSLHLNSIIKFHFKTMSKMPLKNFRTYSLIKKQVIDILEIIVSILLNICTFVTS